MRSELRLNAAGGQRSTFKEILSNDLGKPGFEDNANIHAKCNDAQDNSEGYFFVLFHIQDLFWLICIIVQKIADELARGVSLLPQNNKRLPLNTEITSPYIFYIKRWDKSLVYNDY